MKVLFDHNVDRRFRRHIAGHEIKTSREMRWDALANGLLLKAAAEGGFDVFISIDKNLEYEQNLKTLPLAVVVIDTPSSALTALVPFAPSILGLLNTPLERVLYIVQPDGSVLPPTAPRP